MTQPNPPPDDAPTQALTATLVAGAGPEAQPGLRVGPYQLTRSLGRGGMGEVWLAEQLQPVRRPVALKLMQRQLLNPLAEAYFEVERQALARMDHPAIAKVFDAGRTAEGHPWLAMEWIDGQPLLNWCREHLPDLSTRLRLLAALARGVQHAHARGVLHRDLKPGNVLVVQVDGQSQPKLIDFGIALGLDAGPGNPGDVHSYEAVGSGAYMSPEQRAASAEAVDPRSDVYALGMILLCLLLPEARLSVLGEDSSDAQRLRRRIDDALATGRGRDEPLLAAIPRPLLQLLRRALAPRQADRYASAEALAQDLDRYVERRPLAAMGRARGYRLALFARRNALAVGAMASVVLALAIGLGFALFGLDRASREAERASALNAFLSDVLIGVDPDTAAALDTTLLKRILDQANTRAEQELGRRPDVQVEVQGLIGSTYVNFGEVERGVDVLRRAVAEAELSLDEADPIRLRLAQRLADGLAYTGESAEAESIARAALARAPAALADAPLRWSDLQLSLAWALRDQGRYEQALAEAQAARARVLALGPQDDPDPLTSGYVVAVVLGDLGRLSDAEAVLKPLYQARRTINGPAHPKTLRLANSLAILLMQQGRYAEAVPIMRETLAGYEAALGPEHIGTLGAKGNLAGALRQSGDVEGSGPYYRAAYEGFLRAFGESHPRTIIARANLGNYELSAGDAEASLASHLRARELARAHLGAEHPLISETFFGAGKALAALGRWQDARQALEHALELRRPRLPADHKSLRDVEAELQKVDAELQRSEHVEEP